MSRVTLLAVALLALAGCDKGEIVCDRLLAELRRCDVPSGPLVCEQLGEAEQGFLLQRFEQASCDAVHPDGDADLTARICDLLSWPCPAPLFPDPRPQPTVYPLVFVGGIDDEPAFDWSADVLDMVASVPGNEVHHVTLTPWASRAQRTQDLASAVASIVAGRPGLRVNLICWAVGGLDCRYLVSPGGLYAADPASQALASAAVASITTIATPHRGTDVAQAALDGLAYESDPVLDALLGADLLPEREEPIDYTALEAALAELTPLEMTAFNAAVVDADGVLYQSWAGVSHVLGQPYIPAEADVRRECAGPDGALLLERHPNTYDVMSELLWTTAVFAGRSLYAAGSTELGPSDGMIPVASARWGTFRGCVPADHYDVVGQIGDRGADPNTGFDAARFVANITADLAGRGL